MLCNEIRVERLELCLFKLQQNHLNRRKQLTVHILYKLVVHANPFSLYRYVSLFDTKKPHNLGNKTPTERATHSRKTIRLIYKRNVTNEIKKQPATQTSIQVSANPLLHNHKTTLPTNPFLSLAVGFPIKSFILKMLVYVQEEYI